MRRQNGKRIKVSSRVTGLKFLFRYRGLGEEQVFCSKLFGPDYLLKNLAGWHRG